MKKAMFFENAKLLYDKFGIVPLMYGSLGLEYITNENSVPRNIREAANESNKLLKDEEKDQSVRISTVLGKLDEISNDPNIPVHARTLIWEVLSKLEAI